jgi:hypothetical protein
MALIEDDDVIKTLTADRADDTLDIAFGSLVTELFAGAPKQNPAFGTVGGVLRSRPGTTPHGVLVSVPAYSRFPDTKDCEAPSPSVLTRLEQIA